MTMDESIKPWTAKRKSTLVVEIIQGKTTVAETSRSFDLSPLEIEGWVDDTKGGMDFRGERGPSGAAQAPKMALRANPLDIRERYEKELQQAYGEAMLELRARKKLQAVLGARDE